MSSDDDDLYENIDANKVLDAFGKFGKYQMRTYIFANTVHALYALNMMIMPFITEEPNFKCKFSDENIIKSRMYKLNECEYIDKRSNITEYCNEIPSHYFEYTNGSHSIAADFDLVCNEKGSVEHSSSLFLLGGMLVAPFIMQLADLYGRRLTFVIPLYTGLVANIFCAMAPSYNFFLVFRFISGIAATCYGSIAITLTMESVSTEFRNFMPIAFNAFWIFGYLLSGVLKLYINDWRNLYIAATIPGFLTLPFYWLIPESFHWMVTMKKFDQVKRYIKKAEAYNGVKIDLMSCQMLENFENNTAVKRTVFDIFNSRSLIIHLLTNGYIFIVLSFTYWALSLFSTDLAEDKMTGFFLSGLIEIPGAILTNFMLHFWNRKTVSISSTVIQALCMAALLITPKNSVFLVILPLITKCFSVVLWSSHPLHCSESTPTSIRSVFLGMVGFLRDLGGVIAPYQRRLAAINSSAPTLVFVFLATTASVLLLTLAETKNKELPEDIPDFDPGPVFGKCFRPPKHEEKSSEEGSIVLKE